jgi:YgiT-type zinc finger domain-containing protein
VTYTIEIDGKLIVIERVPARVCIETGEQLFSAETVERIQQLILSKQKPTRVMEVPVFEFA